MATAADWTKAYARQADADFKMYQMLERNSSVKECHKLQFLQMACEKLVKAYLCGGSASPITLQKSHAYIAGTLPIVLRQQADAMNFTDRNAQWVLQHAKHLSQEIELLAPAVKRGGQRPDNCEYPWEDNGGNLHVPLEWSFSPTQLIWEPAGRSIPKLIRGAIDRLLQ